MPDPNDLPVYGVAGSAATSVPAVRLVDLAGNPLTPAKAGVNDDITQLKKLDLIDGRLVVKTVVTPPRETYSIHDILAVNDGPATANGWALVYISNATSANFDCGELHVIDFRGLHPTNTLTRLGDFTTVASPPSDTASVGAAVAEWNMTNRGADTGFQYSLALPETYGGTVPLQHLGHLNLVPEANFTNYLNYGTNISYGIMISRGGNRCNRLPNNEFPRTYLAYGCDVDSLVPEAQATARGMSGGRFLSAYGGTTAAYAPWGIGQFRGFWANGVDYSLCTIASGWIIQALVGQTIRWRKADGTTAGLVTVDATGALTFTDGAGAVSKVVGGPWTTYTPAYTFTGGGSPATLTPNRASYEIVGKTLRLQAQFQTTTTSAIGQVKLPLPAGVTLKHGCAGSVVNIGSGLPGGVSGSQNGTELTIGGGSAFFGTTGGFFAVNITCEIN